MSATVTVATQSSLPSSIASADFVGDGTDDQIAVNAAINSLPDGGLVQLCEGTYTIRANNDGFRGGIVINKSNIQLQGRGPSTRLMLANNQDCNVIRVWGDDIENVVIRDLYIHGNRATNATSNFETCGIRASSVTPPTNPQQNIVVDS
ncbi:MAG: hypothetical protein FJ267_19715, partial [Planctomycetes bacterium]|nr:hypothetical protein [Planctomycetota bacterium]